MDTQMKKGVLEMCILFQLKDRPLYGYELMKSIRQLFPDVYEGSVYTILRRLNALGYTEATTLESSSGPPRKYYGLTEAGQRYLHDMITEWQALVRRVSGFGIPQ